MFEYFFLIIWHVGKPKEPKKGTLKILPQNLNPPPGGPLWSEKLVQMVEKVQGVYVKYSQWEAGNEFSDIFYGQGKLILLPAAFFSTGRSGLSLAS